MPETPTPTLPTVLTPEEVGELLRVSASQVRALARAGELPGRKVGDQWRFNRAAIEALFDNAGGAQ